MAALTGKGRKTRHVPLMSNTAAILTSYLAEYRLDRPGHDDQPVFFNQHGTKLSRGGIAWIIGKYLTRTDDPQLTDADVSPHTLRHSYVISLAVQPGEGRGATGAVGHVPHEYPELVCAGGYVRHVTELINVGFRAERAVSPRDGGVWWVVLDPELVAHREASAFLAGLHGAGRSPHTIRAYAGRAALFLGWCAAAGVDWRRIELAELARFKHWVEVNPTRAGRARSGTTVNAILTAVCELLRFCARSGLIEAAVAERLSEPRWLRFTPPGFDAGESGQFRGGAGSGVKGTRRDTVPGGADRGAARGRTGLLPTAPRVLLGGLASGHRHADRRGAGATPRRHASAAGLPRPGLRGRGRARARAAPGQPEWRVGEVTLPAHGAGQRRGARRLRRLPARAG